MEIQVKEQSGKKMVSARELHYYLEIGKDFSNWLKDKINRYEFIEKQDFIVFAKKGEKGRPTKEYDITIEMAKMLCMVSNSKRGMEVRKYFIAMEKKAIELSRPIVETITKTDLALMIIESEKQIAKLEVKAKYYDKVINSTTSHTTTMVAKDMGYKSAIQLNRILEDKGIQYKIGDTWVLKAKYYDQEFTDTRTYTYESLSSNIIKSKISSIRWTEKGREFLYNLLHKTIS